MEILNDLAEFVYKSTSPAYFVQHPYVADIYVCVVSNTHQVCPKGFYLAIVSTTVETSSPEQELKPGLDLLGPILEKYVTLNICAHRFLNIVTNNYSHFAFSASVKIPVYVNVRHRVQLKSKIDSKP